MTNGLDQISKYLDKEMPWRKGPWQHPDSEAERLLDWKGYFGRTSTPDQKSEFGSWPLA
jgi:hypothetical protein